MSNTIQDIKATQFFKDLGYSDDQILEIATENRLKEAVSLLEKHTQNINARRFRKIELNTEKSMIWITALKNDLK